MQAQVLASPLATPSDNLVHVDFGGPRGPRFADILDLYRTDLYSRTLSDRTRRNYERQFFLPFPAFLESVGLDPKSLPLEYLADLKTSRPLVARYMAWLRQQPTASGKPRAESTLGTFYTALRAFIGFCIEETHMTANPLSRKQRPKPENKLVQAFTADECQRLLGAARMAQGRNAYRDPALVMVLLDTGVRAGEFCNMSWPHIDWAEGAIVVDGKTGPRRQRLAPATLAALGAWREHCPELEGAPIWATQMGTRMTGNSLHHLVGHLGSQWCEPPVEHMHPHRFRHTAAAAHYRRWRDLRGTCEFLGHKNMRQTETYLRSLGAIDYNADMGYSTPASWLFGEDAPPS